MSSLFQTLKNDTYEDSDVKLPGEVLCWFISIINNFDCLNITLT